MNPIPDRETAPTGPFGRLAAPPPLAVAASLAGLEAGLLLLQGLAELFAVSGERAVMGVTTSVFFLVYGAGLALCAVALVRRQSWARAPVVVAQLIQLLVAWSFRGGDTTWVAAALGVVALIVLVGIFHPASLRALEEPTDSAGESAGEEPGAGPGDATDLPDESGPAGR